MTFNTLRKLFSGLALIGAAALVGSCGGGGGGADVQQTGGFVRIDPQTGSIYAGVPFTISITGAQKPYTLTSSEPALLPVPLSTNSNAITVVAANPGVIDADLQPGEVPSRTVTVTVRAANGNVLSAEYRVIRNLLTGYGVSFVSSCPAPAGGDAPDACPGRETVMSFAPVTNGNLFGGRQFRLEVIRGPVQFLFPNSQQVAGNTVTVQSDHTGRVNAVFRVNEGASTQFAVIRIYDIPTGAYVDQIFAIDSTATSNLTILPNELTFTGNLSTECGVGQADVFVFDGTPPYRATSSNSNIGVTPESSSEQPGRFTVRAVNSGTCVEDAIVVVQDSAGGRGTITVNTEAGSVTPPAPPPLAVAPTTVNLVCGSQAAVTVVGGSGGTYMVSSSHPRVTATVAGNTITIRRLAGPDPAPGVFPATGIVTVTDGATIIEVTATVPVTC